MSDRHGISRRRLLTGGAAAAAAMVVPGRSATAGPPGAAPFGPSGSATVPCAGEHQAGIETPLQAFGTFVAYSLRAGVDRDGIVRLMKLWTDDIMRLTQGRPALADPIPELAGVPASLTATVGFGAGLFAAAGLRAAQPSWLAPLPAFRTDALEPHWSAGDLVVQLCADDPMTLSHAREVLSTTVATFAEVAWNQDGFQRAAGMTPTGSVGRNLMGFLDGMVNPKPGTADFDAVVWSGADPAWLSGGTAMVLRRIRLDLRTWSSLSTAQREQVFGRRADDGAPLSGTSPADKPDFDAVDANGLSAIPTFSHLRLAAPAAAAERILRRPYNYDAGVQPGIGPDAGLIFAAYCADPTAQFVPIQRRLAEADLLNRWATTVGSAVFAVPPGFARGGYLGQGLLET